VAQTLSTFFYQVTSRPYQLHPLQPAILTPSDVYQVANWSYPSFDMIRSVEVTYPVV